MVVLPAASRPTTRHGEMVSSRDDESVSNGQVDERDDKGIVSSPTHQNTHLLLSEEPPKYA